MADDWLQAPDEREVRRFHRDPASGECMPWVFIDQALPTPSSPALLKCRRLLPLDAALTGMKGQ